MDHTLNGEMARTNLCFLRADLDANLDGAERLNQIRTNIDDHARILKQSELSTATRSSKIKFVRILIRLARILTPTDTSAVIQIHPARILKRLSTDLEGVVFL